MARKYSGDLNRDLVRYSNGPKQFVPRMVHYSGHVLNSKLIVRFLNGKKFGIPMAFGYQTFYLCPSGPEHSNSYHLNTEQIKFAIQISSVFECLHFECLIPTVLVLSFAFTTAGLFMHRLGK